jgi:hypothetical protein
MWAMFGIAMLPADEVAIRGLTRDSITAWEYARAGDTIQYARAGGDPVRFSAEVRHAGELIGRAETTLKPDGSLINARLTVPSVPARLDLTFLSTARATFAPDIWFHRIP